MIEKIAIENRDQWLKLRGQDCTASTIGCLLGIHPYITPLALHLLKSGMIEEDPEETAPMRRGRLLESVAVQMLREDRPDWKLQYQVGFYYRDPDARLGATPDCFATDENGELGVIQFKSVEPSVFRRTWKDEDGTITPPLWVVCQAIVEAYLTGAEWAAVAALVVGFGVELHVVPVPIHAGIIDRIKTEVIAFWRAVELGKAPDADLSRDGKLLEMMFTDSGETISLESDNSLPALLDERSLLSKQMSAADGRLKEIKTELLSKLNGASAARIADGRLVTAKRISRKAYQVEAGSYVKIGVKAA